MLKACGWPDVSDSRHRLDELAKSHGGLPHKGQQQEEKGDDRQDVHQGAKGLVGLGQLSQRGDVGSETGQQKMRHRKVGPWIRAGSVKVNYHVRAAPEPQDPGATSSANQPAAPGWP